MSAREYADWWRYYGEEPFGVNRDNLHAGIIASAVINASGNRRRGSKAMSPDDFMLRSREEQRERSTAEALAFFDAVSRPAKGVTRG